MRRHLAIAWAAAALAAAGCGGTNGKARAETQSEAEPPAGAETETEGTPTRGDTAMELNVESSAFAHEGEIPTKYTCEGDDVSPPLSWSNVPGGTESIALIVDDPDAPDPQAPKMTWIHWILYNIPADAGGLPEAVTDLPQGTARGKNSWDKTGYGGPCPPIGKHRYYFKVFALDTKLDLNEPSSAVLQAAMEDHVLAKGVLMGTYEKKSK